MNALTPAQKERQRFARSRAGQIREGMRNYIQTLAAIHTAWVEEDWKTLGYTTWQSYVDGEFGADRLQLPAELRRKAVEELRLAGMSTRAIADTLDVDRNTVKRDLRQVGAPHPPEEIRGADGKTYRPAKSPVVEAMTGAIEDAERRATDPGLAGPAPDDGQARITSGTAPEGDTCESPSGAPQDAPDAVNDAGPSEAAAVQPAAAPGHPAPSSVLPGDAAGTDSPAVPAEQGGPATSPAGPPCEKCGGPIATGQAREGYTRCDDCDPDGDHVDQGEGCRGCRVLAETDPAYVLSFGENEHGLHLECGECDGVVAHLKPGGSLPEVLAAAREHYQICGGAA